MGQVCFGGGFLGFFATHWPLHIFILLHTNTKSLEQKYPTWSYSHKYTLKKSTTFSLLKESIINMEKNLDPEILFKKQNPTNLKLHSRILTVGIRAGKEWRKDKPSFVSTYSESPVSACSPSCSFVL